MCQMKTSGEGRHGYPAKSRSSPDITERGRVEKETGLDRAAGTRSFSAFSVEFRFYCSNNGR